MGRWDIGWIAGTCLHTSSGMGPRRQSSAGSCRLVVWDMARSRAEFVMPERKNALAEMCTAKRVSTNRTIHPQRQPMSDSRTAHLFGIELRKRFTVVLSIRAHWVCASCGDFCSTRGGKVRKKQKRYYLYMFPSANGERILPKMGFTSRAIVG